MRQRDLALKIGVDETLVSRWESGLRRPSWFNLVCWADALGVQITIEEKSDAA
jgi:transcriptional regulator with XRE-family HTH domain